MTSAQLVETSINVISNSSSQDYTHPDDRTLFNDNIVNIENNDIFKSALSNFLIENRECF